MVAEYDLVIRGGTIVDGTGVPRYKADLAVKDGRIAKISGKINAGGAREIDAAGCFVTPGAVDLHTHYDAQLNWDPYCSLSGWHGVTSLTIGQCGFGFAPTRPEDREANMRMMNRVEAIPMESMRKGMRWDWETFPQYLDSLNRQGLGVNVGALFPFSPLRGYVMGMLAARERTSVTDAEIAEMKRIYHEAMKAGAFGFSLNLNLEDRADDGGPIPSQIAADEELIAMAEVLGEFGVGHIGQTIGFGLSTEQRRSARNMLTTMMRLSGRPLHIGFGQDDFSSEKGENDEWVQGARAEGLPVLLQQICIMFRTYFKLSEFNSYDYMPNWIDPLVGTSEERIAKLKAPGVREAMKKDVEIWPSAEGRTEWDRVRAVQVVHERNYKFEGLAIKDIAEMTGAHPVDAFLDLALDEDLETEFEIIPPYTDEAYKARTRQLLDPLVHISLSDGGAHTRFVVLNIWPVYWLSFWIRDRQIMSLEQAVYKMSALPAWFADFRDRGTLRVGDWADIIVFDLDKLGYVHEKAVFSNDFPGGERRLIQKPTGLRYTIVNGTVTFEDNDCTDALPGKLLRSYDMVG